MRTLRRSLSIALLVVAVAATSVLAQSPDGGAESRPGRGRGQITAIMDNAIVVTHRDETTMVIGVGERTRFWRDGAPAEFSDLQIGDYVKVRGRKNDEGLFVARFVRGRSTPPPDSE
jgi:hypothetical protein